LGLLVAIDEMEELWKGRSSSKSRIRNMKRQQFVDVNDFIGTYIVRREVPSDA